MQHSPVRQRGAEFPYDAAQSRVTTQLFSMPLNLVIDHRWSDEMRWRWGTSERSQKARLRGMEQWHDTVVGEAC